MGASVPDTPSAPVPEKLSTRQKILEAALQIVEQHGISALTQPKVAKLAGVRQSNLTYYFPRKSDLLLGLLEASHRKAKGHDELHSARNFGELIPFLEALMFDPRRARFFFSVLLEVSENEELRPSIAEHAKHFTASLAPFFSCAHDDHAVEDFVDLLRGIALRKLIEPDMLLPNLADLAEKLGLRPSIHFPPNIL